MNAKGLEPIDLRIGLLFGTVLLLVLALSLIQGTNHTKTPKMYDTDPRCDNYIRDDLSKPQLQLLDKVLCVEKKNNGRLISEPEIQKLVGSKNYSAISAAYSRWRECKDLNRNTDTIVYPPKCEDQKKKK